MTTGRGPGDGLLYERSWRARRAAQRARRRRIALWALRIALLVLVFWFGVALGRALEERPRPGGGQTIVRTLAPNTLAPVTRTMTVTTPSP